MCCVLGDWQFFPTLPYPSGTLRKRVSGGKRCTGER